MATQDSSITTFSVNSNKSGALGAALGRLEDCAAVLDLIRHTEDVEQARAAARHVEYMLNGALFDLLKALDSKAA